MVELTTMRRMDTYPYADRLAKKVFFDVLHLVVRRESGVEECGNTFGYTGTR
jgi:hypothetical protein